MDKLKVTILVCVILLLLIGCGTSETPTAEPTVAPATEVAVVVEPTVAEEMEEEPTAKPEPTATEVIAPTEEVEPTESASPTEKPEPEPTEDPIEELVMDNCQTCHNDQEMLTQTADPVVEDAEPSESSGVG